MKVIVTGSHGLIGNALVTRLTGQGDDVVRLVRSGSDAAANGVTDIKWNPEAGVIDTDALRRAGKIDAAIHLAGAGIFDARWTEDRKTEILNSRVKSADLLVSSLGALKELPDVIVGGSAIGYYGDRGEEKLDENSSSGEGFLAEVCRSWEQAASAASDLGVRVVNLRTGVVLSPKGGALAKQLPLFRLGLGGKIGNGKQYMSWITLYDEVEAIIFCLKSPGVSGPVNATSPVPVTNADFTAELGRVLGRPAALAVPAFAMRLALGSERVEEMLLASQRVFPTKLEDSGFRFCLGELGVALAHLLDRGHHQVDRNKRHN